jgi:hypothetical protein
MYATADAVPCAPMTAAAILAILLLGVLVAFQAALALGAPWGSMAWGGQNAGVLPRNLRIASGIAAVVIYPIVIALVAAAGGLIGDEWVPVDLTVAMWVLAAILALGAVMNFISRSPRERIWGPVALVVAVSCAIIALGR